MALPSIYRLKPAFQNLLRPLLASLAKAGVTANQVTVAAFLLSALGGAAIAYRPAAAWPLLCLPAVLFVRMAMNAIDGLLAREFSMKSRLGAVLNEMGDVASDAALYLPFARVPGVPAAGVAVVVVLAVMVEMIGVVAVQIGTERRYDGPFGKSDRALAFGVLGLALGLGFRTGTWVTAFFLLLIALSLWTLLNRARKALAAGTA
jgi:CDP-diacylglycerol---glycerol-3-phosphate 3-phosphatidyltransferase